MRECTIKISENIYNPEIKEGSICENCIIINTSEYGIEKITNDGILSARFRRSFYDNSLNLVSIEIVAPLIVEVDVLIKKLQKVKNEKYQLIKDQNFNLNDHLTKLNIKFTDVKIEYEISKEESLGKEIFDISGLSLMSKKSNSEIIDMIQI